MEQIKINKFELCIELLCEKSISQVAEIIGKTSSWVQSVKIIHEKLPSRVFSLMKVEKISRSTAIQLLYVKEDDMGKVLDYLETFDEEEKEVVSKLIEKKKIKFSKDENEELGAEDLG